MTDTQVLRIADLDSRIVQMRFESAMRLKVGQGMELSRFAVAEELGCSPRTVDTWLNEGRTPGLCMWFRLCAYFGPDFENSIRIGVDEPGHVLSRHELTKIRNTLRTAAADLDALLGPPEANVTPLNRDTAS